MDNFNTLVKAKTLNQTCVKKIAARGAPLLSFSRMMIDLVHLRGLKMAGNERTSHWSTQKLIRTRKLNQNYIHTVKFISRMNSRHVMTCHMIEP